MTRIRFIGSFAGALPRQTSQPLRAPRCWDQDTSNFFADKGISGACSTHGMDWGILRGLMTSRRFNFIVTSTWVAIVAEIYLRNIYLFMAGSAAFMLCLALGAVAVGKIPRRVRTRREKIACWIIGWPIFATLLVLMAVSVYMMWVLNAPEWVLIFAFLWVLTYLAWKVFIDPNTGPGGWWRRGPRPRPKGPAPIPADRGPRPARDVGATVLKGVTTEPVAALTGRPHQPWR